MQSTQLFLCLGYFNPRSLAGATYNGKECFLVTVISIHAPSRERLKMAGLRITAQKNFNPRSLAGATLTAVSPPTVHANFNPRSLAGATISYVFAMYRQKISIHAPSRERRCAISASTMRVLNFNPRSLAGATTSSLRL